MGRSRRKQLPQELMTVRISEGEVDGYGVGLVDGKPVRVHGVLPGEKVRFRYTRIRRESDEGEIVEVIEASPDRASVNCPQFGRCGGCALQHQKPDAQIRDKERKLVALLQQADGMEAENLLPPLFGESPWGYRTKARLGVKYVSKKEKVLVGFRERGSGFICETEHCPVLDPRIGEKLIPLAQMIGNLSIRAKIPQIEVAIDDQECLLVFRLLQPASVSDLGQIRDFCEAHAMTPYLQEGGADTIRPLAGEPRTLCYRLPEQGLEFQFRPTDFTQVNTGLNRKMVAQALHLLALDADDSVLDLFCGLGNFTLPIAQQVRQVVGVEGDDGLVERARQNASLNGVGNASFWSANLYEPLEAHPWLAQSYSKILLDPPRSGAQALLPYISELLAERIVYVSCNPETLARDAAELVNRHGYNLSSFGVMDMFPHTAHIESIALFERK